MKKLNKIFKWLVCILPGVLFFSYQPLMRLGANESMNFEISLPLIWLVVFDVVAVWLMGRRKLLFEGRRRKWMWALFPVWLSLSVLWSLNFVRGALTAGVLWLVYLAVDGLWSLRSEFDGEFRRRFWKWFLGATLVVCGWCLVQCILDLAGVGREYSLMCAGCTYASFGFPHPNGFAIEPQFMGNLLLAPTMAIAYFMLEDGYNSILRGRVPRARLHGARALLLGSSLRNPLGILLLAVFAITLFLTFSRGAIYAFLVGLVVMSGWVVMRKKKERGVVAKRVGLVWLAVILSFGFTLNLQGVMAEMSPTNDTYATGVAKVINHLSLGVIKVDSGSPVEDEMEEVSVSGVGVEGESREESVENPVENFEGEEKEEAWFDGYVAESTDTRLRLSGAAVKVWRGSAVTALFGVGLGGAGQALYVNGLSPAPKEIVQNQYASLLLETGVVGVSLFVLTLVLAARVIWKGSGRVMVLSLVVAYLVSLCFFSGLPNALQIYLMPAVLLLIL